MRIFVFFRHWPLTTFSSLFRYASRFFRFVRRLLLLEKVRKTTHRV